MSIETQGIYDALVAEGCITELISETDGAPSVFSTPGDVPPSARLPYIVIQGPVIDTDAGTKNSTARNMFRDIVVWSERTGSVAAVEEIAEEIRKLFNRKTIPLDGRTVEISRVTGPIQNDDDDAYGRVVTVDLLIKEP